MKPLMYGYIRVLPRISSGVVERLERRVCHFADDQGYDLMSVFIERHLASRRAFPDLGHVNDHLSISAL